MTLPTRARISVFLSSAIALSLLAATNVAASGPLPDAKIRLGAGSYVGDNIYNGNALNQSITATAAVNQKLTFYISVGNDGYGNDSYKVQRSKGFTNGYRVRYFDANGADVTAQVNNGTFTTPILANGQDYVMSATVKVRYLATECSLTTRLITIRSVTYAGQRDSVRFTAARSVGDNCN